MTIQPPYNIPQHQFIPKNFKVGKALAWFGVTQEMIAVDFPEIIDLLSLSLDKLSGGQCRWVETLLILKAHTIYCFRWVFHAY